MVAESDGIVVFSPTLVDLSRFFVLFCQEWKLEQFVNGKKHFRVLPFRKKRTVTRVTSFHFGPLSDERC